MSLCSAYCLIGLAWSPEVILCLFLKHCPPGLDTYSFRLAKARLLGYLLAAWMSTRIYTIPTFHFPTSVSCHFSTHCARPNYCNHLLPMSTCPNSEACHDAIQTLFPLCHSVAWWWSVKLAHSVSILNIIVWEIDGWQCLFIYIARLGTLSISSQCPLVQTLKNAMMQLKYHFHCNYYTALLLDDNWCAVGTLCVNVMVCERVMDGTVYLYLVQCQTSYLVHPFTLSPMQISFVWIMSCKFRFHGTTLLLESCTIDALCQIHGLREPWAIDGSVQ